MDSIKNINTGLSLVILVMVVYMYKRKYIQLIVDDNDWLENIFDSRQIITIPSRKDHVLKFCNSLNIKPTIFNAILKKDIEKTYINANNLKIGEIACACSQEAVLRNFVRSGKETLLLLEDDNMTLDSDIYVSQGITYKNLEKYLINVMKNIPDDYDVLYLSKCWADCKKERPINKYLTTVKKAYCHNAIVFRRSGAIKIINEIKHPLSMAIDHIVANMCVNGTLKCYSTITPIFYQNRDELGTTLGNNDDLPVCA